MTDLPSNPCDATLTEIAAAIAAGRVSSSEVTEASVARLKSYNEALNLLAGLDEVAVSGSIRESIRSLPGIEVGAVEAVPRAAWSAMAAAT